MSDNIEGPPALIREVIEIQARSFARARAARSTMIIGSSAFIAAVILSAMLFSLGDGYVIALTIAASTLCICWAVMSMSGSLHAQFDTITKIVVYYAEKKTTMK